MPRVSPRDMAAVDRILNSTTDLDTLREALSEIIEHRRKANQRAISTSTSDIPAHNRYVERVRRYRSLESQITNHISNIEGTSPNAD